MPPKIRVLGLLACAALLTLPARAAEFDGGAVVLVNSQAPDYSDFSRLLEPYLAHFGVPYEVRDISRPRRLPVARPACVGPDRTPRAGCVPAFPL